MYNLRQQMKSFKFFYSFIIALILFLLFEGIIHNHYQIFSYYYYSEIKYDIGGYNSLIWMENGLVEFTQVIVLFLSILIFLRYIKFHIKNLSRIFQIILILYFIGLIYYFLEEISYGQHLFFWKSPDFFLFLNSQKETNFHNMSNLFNELPRFLLLLFCSLSFLFIKLISFRSRYLALFILPSDKLKYISYLILLFILPDLIIDIFDINPILFSWEIDKHPFNFSVDLTQLITFNFIRLSELQELLFNFYILCHAYYLNNFFNFKDIK